MSGCSNNPYPPGETAQPVLYTALGDDPKTLDPSVAYDEAEASVIDVIYPAYLQYHYLKRNPFVLDLALGATPPRREPYLYSTQEKGKTVQKRGEAWTFKIKPRLRFQDDPCFAGGKGRAITVADFIYSWKRMGDPAVNCPIVSFFGDKIIGFADYMKQNAAREKAGQQPDYNLSVAGLQPDPKDPYIFRILLNQPYPQLRFLMAMHFTSPLAHEAVDMYGKELARHPVGCGSFMMTEYTSKLRIVLEVNPNRMVEYYPTEGAPGDREAGLLQNAGKQLPLVKKVVFNIIREGITSWNLFLQGYQDSASVTQQNFQQVMAHPGQLSPEMAQKGVQLHRDVGTDIFYYAFNMNDPVFGGYTPQKQKLRQAISTAIDAQAVIDLFNQGLGRRAEFLLPPGIFGYEPEYKNPYRQYSVERAKQLLAEAGYPNGIDAKTGERLTLNYDNAATTAASRMQVGLVQKQIQALGINFVSRATRVNVFQDKLDKGQFQFFHYGWIADYPDAENFLFMLYGPNRRPGPNASGYDNPQYNRLFDSVRIMDDGPQRLALIRKMRQIAVNDCPWIYEEHSESYGLTQPWLHNYKPHPVANNSAKYIGVDAAMRARLQSEWNQPNFWPLLGIVLFLILGSLPAAAVVRGRTHRRIRRSPAPIPAPQRAASEVQA
ncbi:MAG: hypothetical protein JOZ57_06905 [Abitibacteriaceae bacterium]|nr:hypothetical protein [Abditibacteriaceae bacterium]